MNKTWKTGLLLCLVGSHFAMAQSPQLKGYSAATATTQQQLEKQFDQHLEAANIGQTIKTLSAYPHHLGSPQGKRVAEAVLQKFKGYGWDAKLETYHAHDSEFLARR